MEQRERSFSPQPIENYVAKHQDEVFLSPAKQPFAIGIVSRAYRELRNGNLTNKIASLAIQKGIPLDEVQMYIAVNNPRLYGYLTQIIDRHAVALDELPLDVVRAELLRTYEDQNITLSSWEKKFIDEKWDVSSLTAAIDDFRENQASLGIMHTITDTVNSLRQQPDFDREAITIESAINEIFRIGNAYLSPTEMERLLSVSRVAFKKRVGVMGVDCSTAKNAPPEINNGKPTNEAAQIALAQGARYLDISDMDEVYTQEGLREIYDLIDSPTPPQVIIRSLKVVTDYHPDESIASFADYTNWVKYSLTSREEFYASPNASVTYNYSSGTVIVSADAFHAHSYPEYASGEDFEFGLSLRQDRRLTKRFLEQPSSRLILSQRGRDVSWDGKNPDMKRVEITELDRSTEDIEKTKDLLKRDREILERLQLLRERENVEDLPFYEAYLQMRQTSYKQMVEFRQRMRKNFLGINVDGSVNNNGLFSRFYEYYHSHPTADVDEISRSLKLTKSQLRFLGNNPSLLPSLLAYLQLQSTQQEMTAQSVRQMVEEALPHIFALPQLPESESTVTEINEAVDNGRIRLSDVFYINNALNAFSIYAFNHGTERQKTTVYNLTGKWPN